MPCSFPNKARRMSPVKEQNDKYSTAYPAQTLGT